MLEDGVFICFVRGAELSVKDKDKYLKEYPFLKEPKYKIYNSIYKDFHPLLRSINGIIEKKYEIEVDADEYVITEIRERLYKDIHRLEIFHKVNPINDVKFVAYLTYWIKELKPFRNILFSSPSIPSRYTNEIMAMYIGFFFLERSARKLKDQKQEERVIDNLIHIFASEIEEFRYSLRYRIASPSSICMFFNFVKRFSYLESN